MDTYHDYEKHIVVGFWVTFGCSLLGMLTFGCAFLLAIGGIVPLIMGLNSVLEGIDYSYLPLFTGVFATAFSVMVFHSIGYYGIIASGETLKEKTEMRKMPNG